MDGEGFFIQGPHGKPGWQVAALALVAVSFIVTAVFLQRFGLVLVQCICIWAAMVVMHGAIKAYGENQTKKKKGNTAKYENQERETDE
jgi:hypothetical protein